MRARLAAMAVSHPMPMVLIEANGGRQTRMHGMSSWFHFAFRRGTPAKLATAAIVAASLGAAASLSAAQRNYRITVTPYPLK